MERILAVQRMQDYIGTESGWGDHSGGPGQEEITPAGLAEAAHFSPWYARRLFELHTGLAPARYIRRLRLAKSALQLRDEGKSVAEVAFAWGFGSVDGYQRAFRREFGCNPCSYARHPQPLPCLSLTESNIVIHRESRYETRTDGKNGICAVDMQTGAGCADPAGPQSRKLF